MNYTKRAGLNVTNVNITAMAECMHELLLGFNVSVGAHYHDNQSSPAIANMIDETTPEGLAFTLMSPAHMAKLL